MYLVSANHIGCLIEKAFKRKLLKRMVINRLLIFINLESKDNSVNHFVFKQL